jgi:hypothetical protein
MKIFGRLIPGYVFLITLLSCSVSGYITDPQSVERQKKMHGYRTGLNIGEGFLVVASSVGAMFTGVNLYPEPSKRSYRNLQLMNESKDTLFVNMVTDWQWKDSTYFDIRDIVIPPLKSLKVIVPMNVAYNLYFRNDYYAPDDEKMEINTSDSGKIKLKPAIAKSGTLPVTKSNL